MYRVLGADQKEYGPVSAEQIRQWIAERRLNAQSLVMGEGSVAWKPLSTFPEFASLFAAPFPGPGQPQGFPAQGTLPPTVSGYPQASQNTNTFALVGLVMGIVSVLLSCCCSGLPFNILGLVFSIIGLNQIKTRGEKGKEMAIAGIILSALSLVLGMLAFLSQSTVDFQQLLEQMKGKF